MVHRREIDGLVVNFGNQGALLGNAMTWWDHDTGSVWSQPTGEAVAGPRKGTRLEALPVELTSWASWLASHPATLALAVAAANTRFRLEEMAIAVDFQVEAAAYLVTDVQAVGVINDEVAGVPLAVVVDLTTPDRWRVFSRNLGDVVVDLHYRDGMLVDLDTGTVWSPSTGAAISGERAGEVLDRLPGFTVFPGDFPTFWPDGRIWAG